MTTPVRDQIRDYAAYVDEQVEAIEVAELGRHGVAKPAPTGARPRRILVAFIVALLATFAVLLPALLFTRDEPEVATTPPPTSVSTAPSTSLVTTSIQPEPAASSVQELPSVDTAGWTWVPSPLIPHGLSPDGSWLHFDIGYNCPVTSGGFYLRDDLNATCPTTPGEAEALGMIPIADPVERVLTSSDGLNWQAAEVTQFEGFFTHLWPSRNGPHIQLRAVEVEQAGSAISGPMHVSLDGQAWTQLDPVIPDGLPDMLGEGPLEAITIGATVVSRTPCVNSGYLLVSEDSGQTFSVVDGLPGTSVSVARQEVRGMRRGGVNPNCEPHRALQHSIFTLNGRFYGLQYATEETEPLLWTSEDGFSWSSVGPTSGLAPGGIPVGSTFGGPDAIDLGGTVLAMADRGEGQDFIRGRTHFYTSSDGMTWTELQMPTCRRLPNGEAAMHPVAGSGEIAQWVLFAYCSPERTEAVFGHWTGDEFEWYSAQGDRFDDTTFYASGRAVWRRDPNGDVYLAVPPR